MEIWARRGGIVAGALGLALLASAATNVFAAYPAVEITAQPEDSSVTVTPLSELKKAPSPAAEQKVSALAQILSATVFPVKAESRTEASERSRWLPPLWTAEGSQRFVEMIAEYADAGAFPPLRFTDAATRQRWFATDESYRLHWTDEKGAEREAWTVIVRADDATLAGVAGADTVERMKDAFATPDAAAVREYLAAQPRTPEQWQAQATAANEAGYRRARAAQMTALTDHAQRAQVTITLKPGEFERQIPVPQITVTRAEPLHYVAGETPYYTQMVGFIETNGRGFYQPFEITTQVRREGDGFLFVYTLTDTVNPFSGKMTPQVLPKEASPAAKAAYDRFLQMQHAAIESQAAETERL